MKAKEFALAMVLFLSFLPGCNLFCRDLIGSGVFRLETVGVVGCEIVATAVERDGKLYIDGLSAESASRLRSKGRSRFG